MTAVPIAGSGAREHGESTRRKTAQRRRFYSFYLFGCTVYGARFERIRMQHVTYGFYVHAKCMHKRTSHGKSSAICSSDVAVVLTFTLIIRYSCLRTRRHRLRMHARHIVTRHFMEIVLRYAAHFVREPTIGITAFRQDKTLLSLCLFVHFSVLFSPACGANYLFRISF